MNNIKKLLEHIQLLGISEKSRRRSWSMSKRLGVYNPQLVGGILSTYIYILHIYIYIHHIYLYITHIYIYIYIYICNVNVNVHVHVNAHVNVM